MTDVWPIVAVTGHRPKDLTVAQQQWCQDKLTKAAVWLRDERGCTVGISGLALGVDQWFAQAVLDAGLDLWAYVPFPQQADPWTPAQRREWERLLGLATRRAPYAGDLGDLAGDGRKREAVRLLHKRNDMMLADCAAVCAVLDVTRTKGGTLSAVRKAVRRGLPGVHLDPVTQIVRVGLPEV